LGHCGHYGLQLSLWWIKLAILRLLHQCAFACVIGVLSGPLGHVRSLRADGDIYIIPRSFTISPSHSAARGPIKLSSLSSAWLSGYAFLPFCADGRLGYVPRWKLAVGSVASGQVWPLLKLVNLNWPSFAWWFLAAILIAGVPP